MTPRERLFAALKGQPTDRIPIWLLFPYHKLGCYTDVRNNPCYKRILDAADSKVITLNRRHLGHTLFTPEVRPGKEEFTDGATRVVRNTTEYNGHKLYTETRTGPAGTQLKRLLTTVEDLEAYCSLPINTDPKSIQAEMDRSLPQYQAEAREFPAEKGAMMLDLGEPIGPLYGASKLEEYAIWSVEHSALIEKFLDRAMEHYRQVYRYCLERNLADVYFLVGSELASPPLLSRRTFQRWIVPYAKELIAMIHAHGKFAIQHYHGQIKLILRDFLEMAPDGLHTIEAPPTGNCTFTEAFQGTEDRLSLIGNIQYEFFRSATQAEMAQAVRDVLNECRGHRLILSPSAGPYEDKISENMIENYVTFIQTAWGT
jgi:hypothetical protein